MGNGLDESVFWLVSQSGPNASYVRNLTANPKVRVRPAATGTQELPARFPTTTGPPVGAVWTTTTASWAIRRRDLPSRHQREATHYPNRS